MVDPVEDKGSLTERLEEDRQKMAVQVSELKKDYNVPRRLRASVQKYPWLWIMGAVLTGFLLSRLPARRKEVMRAQFIVSLPHTRLTPLLAFREISVLVVPRCFTSPAQTVLFPALPLPMRKALQSS